MSNPRFSIITITFNSEKTVERTLKSVLAQSYTDFEYIIVDGASKDSTMDIVRKYEPLFGGRMKWKSEPDKGIYDAMNKGILRSSGTIVGIVNSDDWLETDALENVNQVFDENGCSEEKIYTGGIRFHSDEGWTKDLMPNITRFIKESKSFGIGGIRHPGTFVPTTIYNKLGAFDTNIRMSADADFLLRCLFNTIEFIPISVILSNMADGGLSNDTTFRNLFYGLKDKEVRMKKWNVSFVQYNYLRLKYIVIGTAKIIVKKLNLYKIR